MDRASFKLVVRVLGRSSSLSALRTTSEEPASSGACSDEVSGLEPCSDWDRRLVVPELEALAPGPVAVNLEAWGVPMTTPE